MSFRDFPFLNSIQKTLQEKSLEQPTEIQAKAIPVLLDGKSLVAVAETGSGKTLSFVLPILNGLKRRETAGDKVTNESCPRAVVVVPTRELGEQVSKVFKIFTHATRLRVRTILGGTSMQVAKENIKGSFEILVATPGRLVQMLGKRQIDLSETSVLIFDEADQMLDQGFMEDATKIIGSCPNHRQVAMFSATISKPVQELMLKLFANAEVIRTKGSNHVVSQLKTENKKVIDGKRWSVLEPLIAKKNEGGTVIFTNTREQCDKLAAAFDKKGIACVVYRGEMDKVERRKNLKAFRDGEIKWMISTDLASRGLDMEHVGRVINYHMPQHLDNYLHRVGRTARAGRSGLVINFVTERDHDIVEQIKTIRKEK